MQKIKILIFIIMGTSALMTAQSVPQGMNYQAVARDHSGGVIANQSISIKVTLQSQKESQGYTEIHKVQTNNLGLFTFIIGNGVSNLGDFQEIPWSTGDIWMELSIDAKGGDNYDLLSENKILTVPYAFHAATASKISDDDLRISGNKAAGKKWSSAGNAGLNDTKDKLGTTDDVDLVIVTNDTERMRISDTGDVGIGTSSPSQKLDVDGEARIRMITNDNTSDKILVSSENGNIRYRDFMTMSDSDADPDNELQDLSLNMTTNELSLSDDASTVDLSMYKELPTSPAPGEMLYWNGTAWVSIAPGNQGQILRFFNERPVWTAEFGGGDVYNPTTGRVWMNRNLGAIKIASSSDDPDSYGDLYQWGRATDGHQNRASSTTSNLSTSDAPPQGDFIITSSSPFDWRSPQNDSLWQGVNGINNPCPSGYRIPTDAEWQGEIDSWGINQNSTGALASPLRLPLPGFRFFSNGSLLSVGSQGSYWSSTVDASGSRFLSFNIGGLATISSANGYRAFGGSIRCIKD